MTEADPPKLIDRHDRRNGRGDKREHPARATMEEQGLLGDNQKLIEREARGRRNVRNEGAQPENAVRNLSDFGFHGGQAAPIRCESPYGRPQSHRMPTVPFLGKGASSIIWKSGEDVGEGQATIKRRQRQQPPISRNAA